MPDHSAERETDIRDLAYIEPIEKIDHIVGKALNRVRWRRRLGRAMPTHIVSQHAKTLGEQICLRLPHGRSGGQTVSEHHDVERFPDLQDSNSQRSR